MRASQAVCHPEDSMFSFRGCLTTRFATPDNGSGQTMTGQGRAETIAVLGLGYVGLPLALALARAGFSTIGFDTNSAHVMALKDGHDRTGEVADESLRASRARL